MSTSLIDSLVVSPNGFGFRSDTGEIFQVNPSACEVIAWMRSGDDPDGMARRLAERHGVQIQRARNDLAAFLDHLENLQLLQRHAA